MNMKFCIYVSIARIGSLLNKKGLIVQIDPVI